MFNNVPPLSYTLNIHPHRCSLDFCLYKLENSNCCLFLFAFFGIVVHLLMGHIVNLMFKGLLGHESSFISRSKEGCWEWVLRRIRIVLNSNCLRGVYYSFVRQCRVNSLKGGLEKLLPLTKKTHQYLKAQ